MKAALAHASVVTTTIQCNQKVCQIRKQTTHKQITVLIIIFIVDKEIACFIVIAQWYVRIKSHKRQLFYIFLTSTTRYVCSSHSLLSSALEYLFFRFCKYQCCREKPKLKLDILKVSPEVFFGLNKWTIELVYLQSPAHFFLLWYTTPKSKLLRAWFFASEGLATAGQPQALIDEKIARVNL